VQAQISNRRAAVEGAGHGRQRLVWHRIRYVTPRVLQRIWHRVNADELTDRAAEVSFYFVLSLFPFFLVIAAIVGWLPSTHLWQAFAQWVLDYFPRLSRSLIFTTILDLSHGYTGFLSFGLLTTLWSASSGFVSLMDALTVAYGGRDKRSYWKKRGIAVLATIGAAIFFLLSFGLWSAGKWAADTLATDLHPAGIVHGGWKVAWWLITLILLCLGLDLLNYFLPNVKHPWRWISPGTVFAATSFTVVTLALNLYVRYSPMLPRVYGTLAGFIILMLWIYVASLILLLGAEADTAVNEITTERSAA
jgi:membrane protein